MPLVDMLRMGSGTGGSFMNGVFTSRRSLAARLAFWQRQAEAAAALGADAQKIALRYVRQSYARKLCMT